MARELGVHAHVIERACHDRGHDRSRVRTAFRRRAVITALAGCYRSDDEPNQQDDRSGPHHYLRKTGSTLDPEGPRMVVAFSSTPCTADTRGSGVRYSPHSRQPAKSTTLAAPFRLRCMVAGDGTRGTRSSHRPAVPAAGR